MEKYPRTRLRNMILLFAFRELTAGVLLKLEMTSEWVLWRLRQRQASDDSAGTDTLAPPFCPLTRVRGGPTRRVQVQYDRAWLCDDTPNHTLCDVTLAMPNCAVFSQY